MEGAGADWFPALELRSLLAAFANVELLVVNKCVGALDLAIISKLASVFNFVYSFLCCELTDMACLDLSSLRLADCSIKSSQSFVLAKLQELQILYVQPDKPLNEIFTPTSAPRLRAVAVYQSDDPVDGLNDFLGDLVAQLEVISLDHALVHQLSTKVISAILPKTLFDHSSARSVELPHTHYMRLTSIPDLDLQFANVLSIEDAEFLDRDLINGTPATTPSILYLPPLDSEHQLGETCNVVERLLETCKSLEIELVFEEQPQDWTLDSGISIDFWRRMKAQKSGDGQ